MHTHEASIKAAVAILTVSDTRSTTDDKSGAIIADCLEAAGHQVIHRELVRDEETEITIMVSGWGALLEVDAIVVTGGTGASPRDVTPEAILPLFSAKLSGFGELFRELSYKKIGTAAMQSRACAVLANGKYIFALPGSSGGVTDAWDGILKYQLDINHKPCNFVELFPRLKEK